MRSVLSFNKSAARLAVVAALMVLLMFLVAARPAQAQATGVYHIVQRGESLSIIAQRYGTTVQAILAANPSITNPNLIFAGQTIFVPPPTPVPPVTPACRWNHLVVPGDTMLKIGRLYGVDPFVIARANNIFNLNLIYAGTTLCIP